MGTQRKKFDGAFKARMVVAALKGDRTMSELASEHGVHANQITGWRKHALEGLPGILGDKRRKEEREWEDERQALHEQIGELTMDIKWLKKKFGVAGR
jgi:transposase-like protein